jgi:hypothetical protein
MHSKQDLSLISNLNIFNWSVILFSGYIFFFSFLVSTDDLFYWFFFSFFLFESSRFQYYFIVNEESDDKIDNVRCIDTLIELADTRVFFFYSPWSTQSIIGVETGCNPLGLVGCSKIIKQKKRRRRRKRSYFFCHLS